MRLIALAHLAIHLCLLLFVSAAYSDENVHKGTVEDWVETISLPELSGARVNEHRNGIAHHMRDSQTIHRPGGYDFFERNVYRIVDRPGLESGAGIDFGFDPARHRVTLNWIRIKRGEDWLDRLPEATPYVYREEKEAERGIFNGRLKARIDIRDVRIGDVIDYAITYEVRPLIGQDLFYERFATQWGVPVGMIRNKITWLTDEPLHIRTIRTIEKPVVTPAGDQTTYLWEIRDPNPVQVEENLPSGYLSLPAVEISTTDRWADIVAVILPHYQTPADLPDSFSGKIAAIADRFEDPGDRMIEAMRLVQDEIRYVSLSMGAGSHIPRRPDVVVESGFGDCKDKSLLLASALRHLGIDADVALTDLDDGSALDQVLPSLHAFDHVIVRASIDGETYWLDPTDFLQGGRTDNYVQPDYGFALPLHNGSNILKRLPSSLAQTPSTTIEEFFAFPTKNDDPLVLRVKTTYVRTDADEMRSRIINNSLAGLGNDYLKYYGTRYPGIESLAPVTISDDRERNELIVEEAYSLSFESLHADELITSFPIRADLNPNLPQPNTVGRTSPIAIGRPRYTRHIVRVSNLKANFIGPENADVVRPYFLLKVLSRSSAGEFEVDWHFRTLMEEVPPSAAAKYVKAVDDVIDSTLWHYNFAYDESIENDSTATR